MTARRRLALPLPHDPCMYFKDMLELMPTNPVRRIDELLPHRWSRES